MLPSSIEPNAQELLSPPPPPLADHPQAIIKWAHRTNGRTGRGSKLFPLLEAERLALELNIEYPDFQHTPEQVAITHHSTV